MGRIIRISSDWEGGAAIDPFTVQGDGIELVLTRLDGPVAAAPGVIERPQVEVPGYGAGEGEWVVTVFNNDHNTYEQVMTILMVATGCTSDEAYVETWEIDHLGRSIVHHGAENECRDAAEIIGTIGIRVEVSKDP